MSWIAVSIVPSQQQYSHAIIMSFGSSRWHTRSFSPCMVALPLLFIHTPIMQCKCDHFPPLKTMEGNLWIDLYLQWLEMSTMNFCILFKVIADVRAQMWYCHALHCMCNAICDRYANRKLSLFLKIGYIHCQITGLQCHQTEEESSSLGYTPWKVNCSKQYTTRNPAQWQYFSVSSTTMSMNTQ